MNNTLIKTYLTLVLITLGALWIAQRAGISLPIYSVMTNRTSEFMVNDEGKVDAKPDKATINAGVIVDNATSEAAAKKQVDEKNNAVIAALTKYGIDKKDIQTKEYSIHPVTDETNKESFNATVTLRITVRNIAQLGQITNIVSQAGANQIYGVDYENVDKDRLKAQAREKGIANAKKQAQQLAKEAGLKLGRITNISVYYPTDGPGIYESMRADKLSSEPAPVPSIEPGQSSMTAQVTLFYEVK